MKYSFEGPLTQSQETLIELITLAERAMAKAVPYFPDDEGIEPLAIAIIHHGGMYKSVLMPIRPLFTDELEEKKGEIMRALFRKLGCQYYAVVTESWVREMPWPEDRHEPTDEEYAKARNTLKKRSALVISGESIDGDYASRMIIITRDASGKRKLSDETRENICNLLTDTDKGNLPRGKLIGLLQGKVSNDPNIRRFAAGALAMLIDD